MYPFSVSALIIDVFPEPGPPISKIVLVSTLKNQSANLHRKIKLYVQLKWILVYLP